MVAKAEPTDTVTAKDMLLLPASIHLDHGRLTLTVKPQNICCYDLRFLNIALKMLTFIS